MPKDVSHYFPLLDERMNWIWQHNFSHSLLTTLNKHAQDTQLIKSQLLDNIVEHDKQIHNGISGMINYLICEYLD